jgi:hypothetical protein
MAEDIKGKKEKQCGRHEYYNASRKQCEIKPYTRWPKVQSEDGLYREIASDLKDMLGAERFKRDYEDVIDIATGEKIKIRFVEAKNPRVTKKTLVAVNEPVAEVIPKKPVQPVRVIKRKPVIIGEPIIINTDKPVEEEKEVAPAEDEGPAEEEEYEDDGGVQGVEAPAEEEEEAPTEEDDEYEDEGGVWGATADDPRHDFLYPNLDDPNFNIKIEKRKEFNDTKYDGEAKDIVEQAEKLCGADFELMPHQSFVKNFLSFQTPYNSLLLFHGLGTGKTCSAIGITEEMRNYMKQTGIKQKIMIIASPNVQDNFMLQLFDERKLVLENGVWNLNTCVGNAILKEINPTDAKGIESDRENIINQVKAIIKQYYIFMGYTQFANYISETLELKGSADQRIINQRIKRTFNNSLIVIDEVHNIRMTDENLSKRRSADLLMQIAKYTDNMRLVLLSATPMYNSYEEIIWLTNLMNVNDGRKKIKISDIFEGPGKFKGDEGRKLLQKKLNGYVSYVRGENPYTFPYRIYPEKDSNFVYPTEQMNGKPIAVDGALKYVRVYMNGIGEYQQKGYNMIIDSIRNGSEDQDKAFEDKDTFGYAILQKPLEALNIVYPSKDFDPSVEYSAEDSAELIASMIGKSGLSNIMHSKELNTDKQYNFRYKPEIEQEYGRIFSPDNLPKYSAKMAKICEIIKKSEGIILIYTQYIDGGAVPMALALEEIGFSRYGSDKGTKSLFKTPPVPPTARYVMLTGDATLSPNNDEDIKYLNQKENMDGKLVKVVIISRAAGEGIDFKNIRQVHIMEPWYNMNRIEQIIGRGVRNLSHCNLPFKKRNVEIFLHATSIGTVETADLYVYRLAEQKAIEIGEVTRALKEIAVDCYLNIGQTNFTTEQLYQIVKNKTIQLSLSSNPGEANEIPYEIGDKPETNANMCDYKDNCVFQCFRSPNADEIAPDISKDTYSIEFAEANNNRIIKRIKELFKRRSYYNGDELKQYINSIRISDDTENGTNKYSDEQIYSALTQLIDNSNELITDEYGRLGHLINNGDEYLFQPVEITDKNISIYERSMPVDVKFKNVTFEIRKMANTLTSNYEQIIKNLTNNFNDVFPTNHSKLMDMGYTRTDSDKVLRQTAGDFIAAVEYLKENVAEHGPPRDKSKSKWWYNTFNDIKTHLKAEYGMTDNSLRAHVVSHMMDNLVFTDKITLLNRMFDGNWEAPKRTLEEEKQELDTMEALIVEHFEDKMMTAKNGDVGIILTKDNKTTRAFVLRDGVWTESNNEIEYKPLLQSSDYNDIYVTPPELLADTIGFTEWFKNDREEMFVMKVKKTTNSRTRGARLTDISLKKLISHINDVLGETKYNIINIRDYLISSKEKLEVLLEIILREYNDTNKNDKHWYLNNEQGIINKIITLSKKN